MDQMSAIIMLPMFSRCFVLVHETLLTENADQMAGPSSVAHAPSRRVQLASTPKVVLSTLIINYSRSAILPNGIYQTVLFVVPPHRPLLI